MKVLVTIPRELYRLLESQCPANTPEFKLLKSGLIQEGRVVIRCDSAQASDLRAWADGRSPGAARAIGIEPDPEQASD